MHSSIKILFICTCLLNFKLKSTPDSLKIVQLFDSIKITKSISQRKDYFEQAQRISVNNYKLSDQFNYLKAKYFFGIGQIDSALQTCSNVLNDTVNHKQLRFAKFYNIVGSVFAFKGDNKTAVLNFQKAISILENNKKYMLAGQINNNIANIFFSVFDYKQAFEFSKQSYKLLLAEKDTNYLPGVTAVYAISAIKIDSIALGRILLRYASSYSLKYNNTLGFLLTNYGLGEYFSHSNQYDSATFFYNKSLDLSKKANNLFYQLINHLALSDLNTKFKYAKLTIRNALIADTILQKLNNNNASYSVFKNLAQAYSQIKMSDSAYYYLEKANTLLKEISSAENKLIINELLIKYETTKKENELNESKIKILSEQSKNSKNKFYILLLSFAVFFVIVIFISYQQIQKRKTQLLKINQEQALILNAVKAEENERERISNELHDSVLSEITALRLRIIENDNIGNALGNIHAQIRKIAHNLFPIQFSKTNIVNAIGKFCNDNNSEKLKIQYYSNTKHIELDAVHSKILYLIFMELLQNIFKHAKANSVNVNLILSKNFLNLSIEDDGIGINEEQINSGQGLISIKKRIELLNGSIEILGEANNGTLCNICIPIEE